MSKRKNTPKFKQTGQSLTGTLESFDSIVDVSKKTPDLANDDNKKAQFGFGQRKGDSVMYREATSIDLWRKAIISAENPIGTCQYYPQIRFYKEVMLDPQVTSLINIRINNLTSRGFKVLKGGKEDEYLTNYFNKYWFKTFQREVIESLFWGYSIFQVGNIIDDEVCEVKSLRREYYNPKSHELLKNFSDTNGINIYEDKKLRGWFFDVNDGSHDYLGLLTKCAPLYVYKKDTQFHLFDLISRFASPTWKAQLSSMLEPDAFKQLELFLKNARNSTYLIVPQEVAVDAVEASTKGSDIFLNFVDQCHSQMAKAILGTDVLNTEGAFVGSMEISAQLASMVSDSDILMFQHIFKDKLVANLRYLGIPQFQDESIEIEIEKMDKLANASEEFAMVNTLLASGKYSIPASFIQERFGIPVTEIAGPIEETPIVDEQSI